jgi:hypothetical protein
VPRYHRALADGASISTYERTTCPDTIGFIRWSFNFNLTKHEAD